MHNPNATTITIDHALLVEHSTRAIQLVTAARAAEAELSRIAGGGMISMAIAGGVHQAIVDLLETHQQLSGEIDL